MARAVPAICVLLSLLHAPAATAAAQGDARTSTARAFSITRSDAALDAIISPDARPELLGDRFGITEGPLWVRDGRDGFLLVGDLTANVIYKIASDGRISVFLDKAGYSGTDIDTAGIQSRSGRMQVLLIGPSCANFDSAGRLLWCADNDGAIMRLEKDGTRTVVAGTFNGKRFNGPNDLVLLRDGSLYFTDPDFGLRFGAKSPLKLLDSAGVWYLKDGTPRKVLDARELGGPPDGIALSPDEKYLYLTAGLGVLKRYEIGADHGLVNGAVFAPGATAGDGLRTDLAGNIFAASGAGPGAVSISSPEGKLLGTINLPVSDDEPKRQICASNIAFGGNDGHDLFITACQAVYRIHLRAAGPVPAGTPAPTAR